MSTQPQSRKSFLERQRDKTAIKDCNQASKKIRTIFFTITLVSIIIIGLFIGFLYIGASCVVRFHFDSDNFAERNINVTPDKPIIVDMSGRYASKDNATFSVNSIGFGFMSPKLDRIFSRELYFFQVFTGRIVSDELSSIISEEMVKENPYMGGSIFMINSTDINNTQPRDISIRYSADYRIYIKMSILVDFIDPAKTDCYINYYYIKNFNTVDSSGRPNGEMYIPLKRFTILDITIKNMTILYPKMEKFFHSWGSESAITSYPYILELNLDYQTTTDFFNNNYNQ